MVLKLIRKLYLCPTKKIIRLKSNRRKPRPKGFARTVPIFFGTITWVGMILGYLAIASTWKRSKKTQLLHELISKTQTWVTTQKSSLKSVELLALNWEVAVQPIEASSNTSVNLGRFAIQGTIPTIDGSSWLSTYDSTIERSAWIQLSPASFPSSSDSRQKCIRRTRMRFLETGLYEAWRWDAFVAPDGDPISLWFDRRNPMPRPIYSRPDFSALEDEEPESNGDVGNGTKIPPA